MTLQILSALIEKLPRELPLYGHSVLNVLETVLHSHDIAMIEETLQTFETFCSHQDLAVLAAEQRYATQYESIVQSYAAFASHICRGVGVGSPDRDPRVRCSPRVENVSGST